MQVSDEAAILGDGDRNTGLRRNWPTALKTKRISFLREITTNGHTLAYRNRYGYQPPSLRSAPSASMMFVTMLPSRPVAVILPIPNLLKRKYLLLVQV